MKPTKDILNELKFIAQQNKLRLSFEKCGRTWIVRDFKGKQIWGGTLKQARRIAEDRELAGMQ